jgi:hypothetical protein
MNIISLNGQDCNIREGDDYLAFVEIHGDGPDILDGNHYLTFQLYHTKVKKVQGRYKFSYFNRVDSAWTILPVTDVYWPPLDVIRTDNILRMGIDFDAQSHDIIYETRAQCDNGIWTPWENHSTYPAPCGSNFALSSKDIKGRKVTFEYRYGYEYYEAQLSVDGHIWGAIAKQSGRYENVIVLDNLDMNTQYYHRHRVKCNGRWSYWAEFDRDGHNINPFTTDCVSPIADEISTSNVNSGTGIEVECHVSAPKYQFRLREKGTSQWVSSQEISQNHYTFVNLQKFVIYEIKCRVGCFSTIGIYSITEWSVTKEHTIPGTCPVPVAGDYGAKNIGTRTATLFCRSGHGTGVTEAHIFRFRKNSEATWTEKRTSTNETNIKNLADFTQYVMQVQHECIGNITGNWSNLEFFTTEQNCKIEADKISVRNIGYDHADLVCQVDRAGYLWKYRKAGGGGLIELPQQSNNRISLTGLSQGTTYEVALKVFCDPTYSDSYTDWVTFTTAPCIAPEYELMDAVNLTNHSGTLLYLSGQQAPGYTWQYKKDINTNWQNVENNIEEAPIDGLSPNTYYNYRLKLSCASSVESDWSSIVIFQTACDAAIRRFSNITSTSLKVYTNASAGADGYSFRYRVRNTASWTNVPVITVPELIVTNLSPNTEYEFQVLGECAAQSGIWSASAFAFTRAAGFRTDDPSTHIASLSPRSLPPCDFPLRNELSATNITRSGAELGCSRGNAKAFQFRYRTTADTAWILSNELKEGTWILSGLKSNTRYYHQARIRCDSAVSDWSDTMTFATLNDINYLNNGCFTPTIPQLIAGEISSTAAILNCLANVDKYQFRYRKVNTSAWISGPEQATNKAEIKNLDPNTVYEFQCRVYCNTAFGAWSASRLFQTQQAGMCNEPDPFEFYAFEIKQTEAKLICLDKALAYQYRYKALGDLRWTVSDTLRSPILPLEDLQDDKTYLYQVRMFCSASQVSELSNIKFFHTPALCPPAASTDLKSDSVRANTAIIQCTLLNSESYIFRYRKAGTDEWQYLPQTRSLQSKLINLQSNTKYEFQVAFACRGLGYTGWSGSSYFSSSLSTAIHTHAMNTFNVYPNPARDVLNILTDQIFSPIRYVITDLSGRQVSNGIINSTSEHISVANLVDGLYVLKLSSGNTFDQIKFLVMH